MPYRDRFVQCPRCQLALGSFKFITGHAAQRCRDCDGIWMPLHIFMELARVLVPDSAPPIVRNRTDSEARLPCPECERDMEKVWLGEGGGYLLPGLPRNGNGNPIDQCEEHGTWFDQSELQAALTSLAASKE